MRCAGQNSPPVQRIGCRITGGAAGRENVGQSLCHAPFQQNRNHFGNHIARAAHDHRVADADIQARDLIGIVQGRIGDHDASDVDRCQTRDRCQCAGSTDLHVNGFHRGEFFLRGKLVGDGPARRAGDETHAFLQVVAIQFVDHAVDIKGQCIALRTDLAVVVQQASQAACNACLVGDGKAQFTQHLQALRVRGR